MPVAGYFRGGPAHSDNSPCSLAVRRTPGAPKSGRALCEGFFHNLILLCSQECILVSAWRLRYGGVRDDGVYGMHGLYKQLSILASCRVLRACLVYISDVSTSECCKNAEVGLCHMGLNSSFSVW